MSLRDQLQHIYEQNGTLTPNLVVEAAKPKNHPLHDRFEWDDKVAGHQFRLVQAAKMIRSVKVVYREGTETEEPRSVRAFPAVRAEQGTPAAYMPVEDVAADPELSALVLREMEREWKQLHRRYGHLQEFIALVEASLDEAA